MLPRLVTTGPGSGVMPRERSTGGRDQAAVSRQLQDNV